MWNNIFFEEGTDCIVSCDDGYTLFGSGTVSCPEGGGSLIYDSECKVNCDPVEFSIGVTSGVDGGCSADDILAEDQTCSVDCLEGYTAVGEGLFTCPTGGGTLSGGVTCVEIECEPFEFGQGAEGDETNSHGACVEEEPLTAISNPTCGIRCRTGYQVTAVEKIYMFNLIQFEQAKNK